MAYSDLLADEQSDAQFLAVLKPRREVSTWTLSSGAIYTNNFTFGQVISVTNDGVALTEVSSSSLSPGEWFFDVDTDTLYIRDASDQDPNNENIVVGYELYVSTLDEHWHRVATDTSTRTVYYEPVINRSPSINAIVRDVLFGILPTNRVNLSLNNATGLFERHVYDSSFMNSELVIYHSLKEQETDDPETANINKVFDGTIIDIGYNDNSVSMTALDRVDQFSEAFRTGNTVTYNTTDFPSLDPNFDTRVIRHVYGVVDGFIPVNVDFLQENPTTSDNRTWSVMSGQSNLASLSRTVPASPSSTTTRTYLDDATGFQVGDSAFLDRAAGVDEYKIVTAVDYSSNYIEHEALASAMSTGDTVKRSYVGNITIVQQDRIFQPLFGRDYTENTGLAGDAVGFDFSSSLESNLSMPETLAPGDTVICRVYGKTNNVTLGGPAFGSDDDETGNLTNPIVILFDLLVNFLGLDESVIETTSFTSLEASITDRVGIAIPQRSTDNFPTYKSIIEKILQTLLLRIYVDNEAKWKISQIDTIGSVTKTIEDDEIINESFDYDINYNDLISKAVVKYNFQERSSSTASFLQTEDQVSAESNNAKWLHITEKEKEFKSLHFRESDAQTLADRLSLILGERQGRPVIKTKNRFFDTELNDIIRVNRTRMPGFAFDNETENFRDFVVIGYKKTLRSVELILDDQKGVEDNPGSF